jgi:hypothetical protein
LAPASGRRAPSPDARLTGVHSRPAGRSVTVAAVASTNSTRSA